MTKTNSEIIGLVECRKCGKTFSHPHKCIRRDDEINELKNVVVGLALWVKKEGENKSKVEKILSAVMECCVDPTELDFEDEDTKQAYNQAKAVLNGLGHDKK